MGCTLPAGKPAAAPERALEGVNARRVSAAHRRPMAGNAPLAQCRLNVVLCAVAESLGKSLQGA